MTQPRVATFSRFRILILCFSILLYGSDELHLFPFIKGDRTGFIDGSGAEVIPAQFGNAGDAARFREGLANVGGASGWGYVDARGKYAIAPNFRWASPFSEGVGSVQLAGEGRGWGFVDREGNVLIQGLETSSSFHDGLAAALVNGKWGYLSRDMTMAIKPQFDYAHRFEEGRAQIELRNRWGYIDNTGRIVVAAKYDITMPFSDGLGRVKVFRGTEPYPRGVVGVEGQTSSPVFRWGCVDTAGVEVIPPRFLNLTAFAEGYALAQPEGSRQMGIVDHRGNFVASARFDAGGPFSEGVAAVLAGDKWGYVDHAGKWVIPPAFASAEAFSNGLARASVKPGVYGYINHVGEWVWRVDR